MTDHPPLSQEPEPDKPQRMTLGQFMLIFIYTTIAYGHLMVSLNHSMNHGSGAQPSIYDVGVLIFFISLPFGIFICVLHEPWLGSLPLSMFAKRYFCLVALFWPYLFFVVLRGNASTERPVLISVYLLPVAFFGTFQLKETHSFYRFFILLHGAAFIGYCFREFLS